MRPEVKRILKLVEEGKLSAEDGAELIDAFEEREPAPAAEAATEAAAEEPSTSSEKGNSTQSETASKDPFAKLIEAIERLSKDVSSSVDWNNVARQVREGAHKGVEAVKSGVEQVTKGRIDLGWMSSGASKDVELPLTIAAGKSLKIENPCGDIQIRGGTGQNRVTAHAKFKGATSDDAKAKAESYVLMVEESDSAVILRQPEMTGLEVFLDIETNEEAALDVRVMSGDLTIEWMKGGARIQSKSGDVRLKSFEGPLEISIASGDVTIEKAITPSLACDGKSGDVVLKEVEGNINLRTASGDVNISGGNSRSLSVECVSGDCNIELPTAISGNVSVRTVSGDARVRLSHDSDCRVSVSTLRGDARVAGELLDEVRADQRVTGKLREGTGSLDVSAVTGDVTLELI